MRFLLGVFDCFLPYLQEELSKPLWRTGVGGNSHMTRCLVCLVPLAVGGGEVGVVSLSVWRILGWTEAGEFWEPPQALVVLNV